MIKSLPTITSQLPQDLRLFTDRLRDAFNAKGAGQLATYGDLVDAGLAKLVNNKLVCDLKGLGAFAAVADVAAVTATKTDEPGVTVTANAWCVVQTLNVKATGYPAVIFGSAVGGNIGLRIKMGNSVIIELPAPTSTVIQSGTLPAGDYVFVLEAYATSAVSVTNRSLSYMESKR